MQILVLLVESGLWRDTLLSEVQLWRRTVHEICASSALNEDVGASTIVVDTEISGSILLAEVIFFVGHTAQQRCLHVLRRC